MEFKRKQTIVYAKGFVGSFVEQYAASLPENAPAHLLEQSTQLSNMFEVLSQGLAELMKENDSLQLRLDLINQAYNTQA